MVYQAEVTTEDGRIEFYIGSTSQTFKSRFKRHRLDMNNPNYRDKGSKLAKFVWELKDEGVNYQIKWRIVDRAPPYNPRTRKCALCVLEAYYINYHYHISTCRHRNLETLATA